jgi:hypothetical protein
MNGKECTEKGVVDRDCAADYGNDNNYNNNNNNNNNNRGTR